MDACWIIDPNTGKRVGIYRRSRKAIKLRALIRDFVTQAGGHLVCTTDVWSGWRRAWREGEVLITVTGKTIRAESEGEELDIHEGNCEEQLKRIWNTLREANE